MTIDWLKDRTTGLPFYPVTHEDAVIDSNSVTLSTKLNLKLDKLGKVIGSFNRTNVSGSGALSIYGTAGQFPTISTAGTYTIVTYMKSSTSSYTLNVTFGSNSYSLTSSSGIINDSRLLTLSANSTWSGSVTTVAANTEILVYIVSNENVYGISKAGITGNYDDLSNKPSIPSAPGTLNTNNSTAQTVSSSEALSGTIKLHKISKTGKYSDLIGVPTTGTSAQFVKGDGSLDSNAYSTTAHTHGNITAAGALQTTDVAIANGDKLVVTDSSNSNKVARTSLSFDGSTTTKALTQKGTFEYFQGQTLYIDINYNDNGNVPLGTFQSTVNARNSGIDIIIRYTDENDSVWYFMMADDDDYNQVDPCFYFINVFANEVKSITIDGNDCFTFSQTSLSLYNHTHGNITNDGKLQASNDISIANGDKLIVTDSSDSNKIARTSLSFDGSTTTQALTKKGTFETFIKPVTTSTDNAVVRFDGTSGNIQNSGVTIDDSNNITAVSFKKSGGTSAQFLKADGSVDSNTYATSSDSRFGKVSQTATDSNWADYEILFSGSANNTTATEITRKSSLLKFNPARNKLIIGNPGVIEFSATSSSLYEANHTLNNVTGNSPMPKYTWHDLFAFCRVVTPTYYISNDNSTWTESTLNKNLFNQKLNLSIIILPTSGNTGARWIWNSTSYLYCMGAWLVLGFTWQSTPATVTVVFDTSSDGTTWTERHNSTLTCGLSPVWFYAFSSLDHRYIRLTITKELTDSGACSLSAIKWLTSRWGGLGQGIEYEYPYDWDINGNIMSINAENCNLGATNNYWNNVYAKLFIIKNGTSSLFLIGANDVCKLTENPYVGEYLTFTALSNTTFTFSNNSLQYSTNNGSTWTTLAANTASPTITTGNKILWKLTGLTPVTDTGIGYFSSTGNFEVSGNIMSLHYGDNFIGQIDLTGKDYAFYNLFYNCTKLISALNLVLPALTLSRECYTFMFRYCSSLVIVPKILPATKLANNCYSYMFSGCTSLIKAPELPAITLTAGCYLGMFGSCSSLTLVQQSLPAAVVNYCYYTMFQYCTSLTTAPELPATTLASNCYYRMFNGCTSLRYVKCLATDISATNCTTEWLNNVSSSGDFVKNNNMAGWTTGVSGIPTTWLTYNNSLDYDARGYHIERLENTIGDINTILDNIIGSNIIGYCWANSDTTHVPFSLGETITYRTLGTTNSFNILYLGDESFTDEIDWVFGESDDIMDLGGAATEYTGGVVTFDGRDAGFDGTFEEGHTVYIFLNLSLLFSINFI